MLEPIFFLSGAGEAFPEIIHLSLGFFHRAFIAEDEVRIAHLLVDGELGLQAVGRSSRLIPSRSIRRLDLLFFRRMNHQELVKQVLEIQFDQERNIHQNDGVRCGRGDFSSIPS